VNDGINGEGGKAIPIARDVTDDLALENVVGGAIAAFGKLTPPVHATIAVGQGIASRFNIRWPGDLSRKIAGLLLIAAAPIYPENRSGASFSPFFNEVFGKVRETIAEARSGI
jgi:hypothetical protein